MKVALVHDHLNQIGGAENVLKALHEVFPDAPVFTLIYDKKVMKDFCDGMDIRTSFIQKIPGGRRFFKAMIPFMPTAIERFDLTGYDVVISSNSAYSKGVITSPETMHICYCYTPTRYLWHDTHNYTAELPTNRLLKGLLPFVLTDLRTWDHAATNRVDYFVGISRVVQERIKKYYQRSSEIIYPPVHFNHKKDPLPVSEVGNYFLIGGRFRPYKRFDLAIKAFNKIGIPLKVFGQGEEEEHLRSIAGPNIEFLGPVSQAEKEKLFAHARAFLHPAEEDFGITQLESMSFGRPVIAFRRGGALDTVVEGVSGEFFNQQTVDSLLNTLRNFDFQKYDPKVIHEHALSFEEDCFKENFRTLVKNKWEEYRKDHSILFHS